MKSPLYLIALSLALSACEASVQTSDDLSLPSIPPPHFDNNTATLCSWAHDAGFNFDGDRTEMEQQIFDAYSNSGNRASGRLKIYLDCDNGEASLEWNIDSDTNDAWNGVHTQYKMNMPINGSDGTFSLSGSTRNYRGNGYNCSESQESSGVSHLELAQRDLGDPDLLHLTVHVSGTITDNNSCSSSSDARNFDTAYRIDLHRIGERFNCTNAQYDANAQAIDRVCRGHYN